jgi:transglutaminase-like putative cysteine protease
MSYVVSHRTTYKYQSDVAYSRLVAHLAPRATTRQRSHAFEVTLSPAPAKRSSRADYFGNTTNWFTIDEPHTELEILAESTVSVDPIPIFEPEASPSWEVVRTAFEFPVDAQTLGALHYTFDTRLTATNEDVFTYARCSFKTGQPLLACILDLNSRIHADFTFDKEATDTRTTVKEAFELRAGVCQDLAHVGLAAVRAMGLAARYVSGYLLTHPPPGKARLVGADASHAWFSVWIPPYGWIDFDPTNDMLPSCEHITVAWGRDYGDVAPIHGIVTGGSEHEVDVAVDVMPVRTPRDGSQGKAVQADDSPRTLDRP